jgi:hypothetical protein
MAIYNAALLAQENKDLRLFVADNMVNDTEIQGHVTSGRLTVHCMVLEGSHLSIWVHVQGLARTASPTNPIEYSDSALILGTVPRLRDNPACCQSHRSPPGTCTRRDVLIIA